MPKSLPGIEELLQNDEFVRWVTHPDETGNQYWEAWTRNLSEKAALLARAKELVLSIYSSEWQDAEALKEKNIPAVLWEKINEQVGQGVQLTGRVIPLHPDLPFHSSRPAARRYGYRYMIAASLIGLVLLGGFWFYRQPGEKKQVASVLPAERIVHSAGKSTLECVNNGPAPQMIYLVDGTRILLGKNSRVRYEKFLDKDKREISLEGEAFFDVAKDQTRPFYVHTRGLLTRVLGTSFRIIARKNEEKITVAVRTGKVSVSPENPGIAQTNVPQYILQANQEAVFNKHLQLAEKTVVTDTNLLAKPSLPAGNFSFSDTKVSTILQNLADTYSVNIEYDQQQFSKCLITVSLDALSLDQKLDLLCKVLGVQYRIADYRIYIEGHSNCN